ncbi:sugar ABC transporter ATP-binding protein [Amnibacterium kyonggiense]|uniref:Monosaccharide ABC transporter ATP-binding protein (CUT2 family) n=1 Tax=Amnibacterium kyonggiense TaxID=595671 RepID=A0A4R7FS96_9MICO|nr:sugar ABC transporter ATP-binding protein [Amnibacterium kyonggiense]TDS80727.1 monosaccharide ABC transporter ATP-binding protein (CUT2 family) [Amnibacterium kyonggiense]
MTEDRTVVLAARGVGKRFGETTALAGVSLEVRAGEVLGLVGANGAGKSTLTKILSGTEAPTSGHVEVRGRRVRLASAEQAREAGIETVHQDVDAALVPDASVAENLVLPLLVAGRLGRFPSRRRIRAEAARIAADRLPGVDLDAAVEDLGVSDRQRVLIARGLATAPSVLVLDEPTAALSVDEQRALHATVRELAAQGTAVVFITHHLGETVAVCDRVVALRDGAVAGEFAAPLDAKRLAHAILGGLEATAQRSEVATGGEVVLDVAGAQALPGGPAIELVVRRGEVLGITGLLGSGKTELLEQLAGVRPVLAGTISIDGVPFRPAHPVDAIAAGVGFVPEDRARAAELPGWSVADSLTLPDLARYRRGPLLSRRAEDRATADLIRALGVVCSGPRAAIESLSGGNRQKVVVGRWFAAGSRLLILDEPFRGVDIGARADIARLVRGAEAAATVVASSDPEEILEVADRVLVMADGGIVGEVDPRTVDAETLADLMTRAARPQETA